MDSTFSGVVCPLVTPLVEDASRVDEGALRRVIDAQIADGVGGLIACGTTGEFFSLTSDERQHVAEVTLDQTAGRVPVMVQTGSTSTDEVVRLSKHASDQGAAGLLLPPPFYGSYTDEELEAFFSAVAEASHLPICIYNIPSATGVGMSVEFLIGLAERVPAVSYIKDSSGDLAQQTLFLQDHAKQLTLLCGEELLVAPGLLLGMTGAVIGSANLISKGLVQLMEAGANRDFDEVARLNEALTPLMRFIVDHPYVATVKHAMELAGMSVGPVRRPLKPLASPARDELAQLLKSLDPSLLSGART